MLITVFVLGPATGRWNPSEQVAFRTGIEKFDFASYRGEASECNKR